MDEITTLPDMIVTDSGALRQLRESAVLDTRDFMTLPDIHLYSGDLFLREFGSDGAAVIQGVTAEDAVYRMVVYLPDNLVLRQVVNGQLYELIGILQ